MVHPENYSSFDCGHLSSITPPGAQIPQRFPYFCVTCTSEEAERRERQIYGEYNPLIGQARDAESEGKRMLKMHEWRNDMYLATEIARAGAEATRLKRIRDRKLIEAWKEWKDIWASNNGSR